jgi:hypothetical protein
MIANKLCLHVLPSFLRVDRRKAILSGICLATGKAYC